MADYWKSQARKYCDFCKCWIADNKPSIEFHENGKKHKEAVSKRIKDIHKNSAKQAKIQKKFQNDLDNMEKAAMAAYMKDVEGNNKDISSYTLTHNVNVQSKLEKVSHNLNSNPGASPDAHPRPMPLGKPKYTAADVDPCDPFAAQKLAKIAARDAKAEKKAAAKAKSEAEGTSSKGKRKRQTERSQPVRKVWYEVKNQGYSYYWNTETNLTSWEPPAEGFMSIQEQEEEAKEQALQESLLTEYEKVEQEEKKDILEEQRANAEREKLKEIRKKLEEKNQSEQNEDDNLSNACQPTEYTVPRKPNPYGSWQVVRTVEKPKIDLQLPKLELPETPAIFEEQQPPPRREFKEKVITSLSTGDSDDEKPSVLFKKRKIGSKNVRKPVEY